MPTMRDALKNHLALESEIDIRVTGRTSGRAISFPIWFVYGDDKVYLLPVRGSDTQWYKNILRNPSLRISAKGGEAEFAAVAVTDPKQVSAVVEQFRGKYGDGGVALYKKLDVAVVAQAR